MRKAHVGKLMQNGDDDVGKIGMRKNQLRWVKSRERL